MKSHNLTLLYTENIINQMDMKKYLLIIFLSSLSIFVTFNGAADYFSIFISSLSYSVFVLLNLSLLIYNAIDISKHFDQNYMYVSRFKNLKEYYKNLIKSVLISNSYLLFIIILFLISTVAFSCNGNFNIPSSIQYNIPFLILFFYYFMKFVVIMLIISVLGVLIYKFSNVVGILIYYGLIIFCVFSAVTVEGFVRKSIIDLPMNFINYLIVEEYITFIHDIIAYSLYIFILLIIISIILKIIIHKREDMEF